MIRFFDFVVWFSHYLFRSELPIKFQQLYSLGKVWIMNLLTYHAHFNLQRPKLRRVNPMWGYDAIGFANCENNRCQATRVKLY